MFRGHWHELEFWKWWMRSGASAEARVIGSLFALVLALGGGVFAAISLTRTSHRETGYLVASTVERYVTLRESGKVVQKLVPVTELVTRSKPPKTAVRTEVVKSPGATVVTTSVVTSRVTKLVPKVVSTVERRTVTADGKTRTTTRSSVVTTTKLMPTTNVVTAVQTETVTQTVVQQAQPVTETQVVTVTTARTVTQPAVTETLTVTAPLLPTT